MSTELYGWYIFTVQMPITDGIILSFRTNRIPSNTKSIYINWEWSIINFFFFLSPKTPHQVAKEFPGVKRVWATELYCYWKGSKEHHQKKCSRDSCHSPHIWHTILSAWAYFLIKFCQVLPACYANYSVKTFIYY